MAQSAGWLSDPYGRFEQRYWDGEAWTEHVSTGGTQSIDPLGASTVIPIATPASAFGPASAFSKVETNTQAVVAPTVAKQPQRFLDALGPDAHERPAPRLSIALAGGGGALIALGIAAGIFGDDESRGKMFAAAAVILGVALAVRFFVMKQADLRSAAVGAGVVGLFLLGGAIVADDVGDAWAAFIVGALFLAAWVLPGFRGRSLMLGIGTLLMVAALGSATSSGSPDEGFLGDVPFSDSIGDQGVVFLLAAAVLLGLVWWLDRAGYRGVGTGLVVPALVSAFVGAAETADTLDNKGGALLILAVGLVVCFVGSSGDRRATTWWGALLSTIGVVGFFASTMKPDSVGSTATMLLISGALLVAGPAVVRAVRSAQTNKPAPPAASTGTLPPPSI